MHKTLLLVCINACVTYGIATWAFNRKFEELKTQAFRCDTIECRAIYPEYIAVRQRDKCGEQPAITFCVTEDSAGINVTNGKDFATVWCLPDRPLIETKYRDKR